MKTELSKIAQDLEQGTIDETEAQDLLLGLLGVSKSVFYVKIRRLFSYGSWYGGYGRINE